MVLDTNWDEFNSLDKGCNMHKHLMNSSKTFNIPMNGDSYENSGSITNKLRDYIWYFSINTC